MKNLFKKILLLIKFTIDFIIFFYDIIFLIYKFRKKKLKIILKLNGGFGHLITTPHYLKLTNDKDWVLIFGIEAVHNKLIKIFFKDNLFFIRKGIHSSYFEKKIEKFIINLFNFCNKQKVILYDDIILKKLNYSKKINEEEETFVLFNKKKINYNIKNIKIRCEDFNRFLNNEADSCKGIINFHLRYKKNQIDHLNYLRDSNQINFYKNIFEYLVNKKWKIIITGEDFEIPEWIKNYRNYIFLNAFTNLSKDYFNLYTGISSDVYIGNMTGPIMWELLKPKKRNLVLNCYPIGFCFRNSIFSYPMITNNRLDILKQSLVRIKKNYSKDFFLKNFKDLDKIQCKQIIEEFIENLDNPNYGVGVQKFGINHGVFVETGCKISPKWLKLNKII
ncbi:hypothetical protein [Candidatus Pelagibacter sp. HIMB1493]|uniref:hypothetical protein n=1 Tax=Candidatus Pelagibacter sp. HIMB1493 TaxID=3413334 RepID=UPI003F85FA75